MCIKDITLLIYHVCTTSSVVVYIYFFENNAIGNLNESLVRKLYSHKLLFVNFQLIKKVFL